MHRFVNQSGDSFSISSGDNDWLGSSLIISIFGLVKGHCNNKCLCICVRDSFNCAGVFSENILLGWEMTNFSQDY